MMAGGHPEHPSAARGTRTTRDTQNRAHGHSQQAQVVALWIPAGTPTGASCSHFHPPTSTVGPCSAISL